MVLRVSFKAEYDAIALGTSLVDLTNSSTPTISAIIDKAMKAGAVLEDVGFALHCGGQIRDVSETDLATQRLLATKASLEVELQRHRLDIAKASFQTAQWERQAADAICRNKATRKRARALCYAGRCAWPGCLNVHAFMLVSWHRRSCNRRQVLRMSC